MNNRVSTQNHTPSPLNRRTSATAPTNMQRPVQPSGVAQRKAVPNNSTPIAATTTAPQQRQTNGMPMTSASYRDLMQRRTQSSSWSGSKPLIPNGIQSSNNAPHRQSMPNGHYLNGNGGTNGTGGSSPYERRGSSQGMQQAEAYRRYAENGNRSDTALTARQSNNDPPRPSMAPSMRRSTLPPP